MRRRVGFAEAGGNFAAAPLVSTDVTAAPSIAVSVGERKRTAREHLRAPIAKKGHDAWRVSSSAHLPRYSNKAQ